MFDQEERTVIKLIAWGALLGTAIPDGSGGFLISSGPDVNTMDSLTRYMIFFLACMAAIVLLTSLPDRGDNGAEAAEKPSEAVEHGLDPLHQIEC